MSELTEQDGTIVLPERMDMAVAKVLRDLVLASARDLKLDAAQVAMMTTPALQVVMAARDHQAALGKSLEITDPSSGFKASARTLGVSLDRLQTTGASA